MDRVLDLESRRRAVGRCEYCRLPESAFRMPFVLDHIIARQHGGRTESANLALCCGRCNLHKGPNIASIDPQSVPKIRSSFEVFGADIDGSLFELAALIEVPRLRD